LFPASPSPSPHPHPHTTTCELRFLQQQSITHHRITDQEAPNTPKKIMEKKNPSNSKINDGEKCCTTITTNFQQLGVFPIIMKMLRTRRERRNST